MLAPCTLIEMESVIIGMVMRRFPPFPSLHDELQVSQRKTAFTLQIALCTFASLAAGEEGVMRLLLETFPAKETDVLRSLACLYSETLIRFVLR